MEISIKWNVCRICMEEESKSVTLKPIFEVPTLPNDIYLCSGVELKKTDNLPDKICQKCLSILKYATKFRMTCQKTTEYLNQLIRKTQTASNIFKSNKSTVVTEAEVAFEGFDFLEEDPQTQHPTEIEGIVIDGTESQIIESHDVQYVIHDVDTILSSREDSPAKSAQVSEIDEVPVADDIVLLEDNSQNNNFLPEYSTSNKNSETDQYEQDEEHEVIEQDQDQEQCQQLEQEYEVAYLSEDEIKQEIYDGPDEDDDIQSVDEILSQIEEHIQVNEKKPDSLIKDELKSFPRKYIPRPREKRPYDFICDICGNHFKKKCLLTFHMKLHRNEKNYECEICKKRFTSPCNLRAHIRTHTGEKPFHCKYCERKFADRSTQIKHERIHTNEKPYSCTTCGKAFSLTTSLKAHEKMHTGERPYRCEPCSKAFTLPHQLKAHLQTNMHRIITES